MITLSPSRIVMGTVQLGLPYGRRAGDLVMPERDAFAILDAAWDIGIRAFDTAEAYGVASERLGRWLTTRGRVHEALVVTKVRVEDSPAFAKRLSAGLDQFAEAAQLTVLTHGAVDSAEWERFVRAVEMRRAADLGQSVYTAEEVREAFGCRGVSRVQAPGNVFDRRALTARGASWVPLDLRSVYLQGVLLEDPRDADRRAPGAGALAVAVNGAAARLRLSPAPLLIAAALDGAGLNDRVVIGVDRASEIADIAAACTVDPGAIREFTKHAVAAAGAVDARTLDPRTWPRHS